MSLKEEIARDFPGHYTVVPPALYQRVKDLVTTYNLGDQLWICRRLTAKWEWTAPFAPYQEIFARALEEFQQGQYYASLQSLAPPLREMASKSDISPAVRQAIEGGLDLLSRPPVTRFTAAFAFHLLDALFYIMTPPNLLFADIWKVVPFKGMTAVHACLIAMEVAKANERGEKWSKDQITRKVINP